MRRTALALACVIAAPVALSACGDDDPKLKEQTLRYTEREKEDSFEFIDNPPRTELGRQGPERLSRGDQLTFAADLLDASRKDVGDLDAHCLFIQTTGQFDTSSADCSGVVTLPGGSLTVSVGGKPFRTNTTRGAITGGTGRYAGAIGEFTSVESGEEAPARDTFRIFVPEK